MIRPAMPKDASRIAEISIFAKRAAYRHIFKDDLTSFGKMQVLPLALSLTHPGALEGFYVLDDGFVRGFMHVREQRGRLELNELYVDPLLQGEGCGRRLMEYFLQYGARRGFDTFALWVLEDNRRARDFYSGFGFAPTGQRLPECDGVWKLLYKMSLPARRQ